MAYLKKHKLVVGLDEAGRGGLAGPVIAAAITFQQFSIFNFQFSNVKDSKKLSSKQREEVFELLRNHPCIEWGIGRVGPKVIDRINILQATKLAMKRAVKNLNSKFQILNPKTFLLIDGNFGIDLPVAQKSIIKGDEKVFLIKAASIAAKVTRDRAMLRYHKRYPQYGFDKHKGYGTKPHFEMLKKFGPCPLHRKTFRPVNKLVLLQK